MALKILVNALGQHVLADVKQVENTATEEVIAYWVKEPRVISYRRGETGNTTVNFLPLCPVAVEQEYSISSHHIVSILTPTEQIVEAYNALVYPTAPQELLNTEIHEQPVVTDSEEQLDADSAD